MEGRDLMASNDFIYDLLDHLKKDNMDYLLITVDKGGEADQVELFYSAESTQSEQCIVYCFNKLIEEIKNGQGLESPDGEHTQVDYGWVNQEELDEYSPPLNEDDEEDEDKN